MSEERNTRREILKKVLTLGPLAALAGAFGGNGPKPAQAATYNEDVRINGNLAVMPGASPAGPGNVGIGTTGPSTTLHIKSAVNEPIRIEDTGGSWSGIEWIKSGETRDFILGRRVTTGTFGVYSQSVGDQVVSIKTDGSVGIGTTGPSTTLHIKSAVNEPIRIEDTGGSWSGIEWIKSGETRDFVLGRRATTGTFGVYSQTTGDQVLSIQPGGNVGIGTPNPVVKLDVVGDIRLTGSVLPVGGGVFEGKARRSYYDT